MKKLLAIVKAFIKRKIIDFLRKVSGLKTSMDIVVLTLQVCKLLPKPLIALEVFGKHGLGVTRDYAHLCDYLELWEIDTIYAKFARKFLPEAVVKIGDSIDAVKTGKLLRNDYNFIVIDNPIVSFFGSGNYCEHFDLFPALLKRIADKSILIMNVVVDMKAIVNNFPYISLKNWTIRRKEFYQKNEDKEVIEPNVETMINLYKKIVSEEDFTITNAFLVPRDTCMVVLVIVLKRNSKEHPV